MDELSRISRIVGREPPDYDKEALLAPDITAGQDTVNQAGEFQSAASLTSIVLIELDGTVRGGVVLPIRQELGLPAKLIGLGEEMGNLQPFEVDEFAAALFKGEAE